MLLAWVFALTSRVANACFLKKPALHSRAAKESAAAASHASAELLGQGAPAGHDDDLSSTKVSCLKVCDNGTNAVLKAYSGHDHTDPGPAPWVTALWTGSADVVSALRGPDALAIPVVGPPIRVRYSRLAL